MKAARAKRRCETREARVRRLWGTISNGQIGNCCGVTAAEVAALGRLLGLGENPWRPTAVPAPPPPAGFSTAQVMWARRARTAEAALIRGILGELPGFPRDGAAKGMARR